MYYRVQYHGSGWRTWCIMTKETHANEAMELLMKMGKTRTRIKVTKGLTK